MSRDYNICVRLSPAELDEIEPLIQSGGFSNRQNFLRACVNTYAQREILSLRVDPQKRKFKPTKRKEKPTNRKERAHIPEWIFSGGYAVVDDEFIYLYFSTAPEMETRLKLRLMHFVPKGENCWKVKKSLRVLHEIGKMYPEIK